jgi:serralysin
MSVVALAGTGLGLSAGTASAQPNARVHVDERQDIIYYTAGSGQRNNVTLTAGETRTEFIIDDVVPIEADPHEGCSPIDENDPTRVKCTLAEVEYYTGIDVTLGDRNDRIDGDDSGAINYIYGGAGDDTMSGAMVMWGEDGNDTLSNADSMSGGYGRDTLTGAAGTNSLRGGPGHDILLAGDGNDFVYGDGGDDHIRGGRGDDLLRGGRDEDLIYGNSGDDVLFGGPDADELSGGPGTDQVSQD